MSKKRITCTKDFIEKAKEIHNDFYDYSKAIFNKSSEPITIICPMHGEFLQTPEKHLKGRGCPKCGVIKRAKKRTYTTETFIEKAKEIHNDFYDYSKTEYLKSKEKVIVTCPLHGDFLISPNKHLCGEGCDECKKDKIRKSLAKDVSFFKEQSFLVHNGKYDYSKSVYKGAKEYVSIICHEKDSNGKEHGEFLMTPDAHLNQKQGCPKCAKIESQAENEIYEFVCDIIGKENVRKNDRIILKGLELDIYIPSLQIAIEYNGIRWHSEMYKDDKSYHLNKLNKCNEHGIALINIFEDEYINNKDLVLQKIKHILKCETDLQKIMARKCVVREIDKKSAEIFLNKNHIQGFVNSTIYLGCFYNNLLVGVMTFLKEKERQWNLTRFASANNYICNGIGGKLFKYFVRTYSPLSVKSFADRRWTLRKENNIYVQLGFKLDDILPPDYRYYYPKEFGINRMHKFGFRKQILNKKYGLPLTMTESEMCRAIGAYRIYDCGLFKYVWKK